MQQNVPLAEAHLQEQIEAVAQCRKAGKLVEAESICRELLAQYSGCAEVYYELGATLCQQGRTEAGRQMLQTALEHQPDLAGAHYYLALAWQQQGRLEEACEALYRLLELQSESETALATLGEILRQLGHYQQAIPIYHQLLILRPQDADVHTQLGLTFQALGRQEEAMFSFNMAINHQPHFAPAHKYLGDAFRVSGQLPKALQSYAQALKFQPDFAAAHNGLGLALGQLGRSAEAVLCFKRAIACQPHFALAHNNLGNSYRAIGQLDQAIQAYIQALKCEPDFAGVHYNLGNALKDKKQFPVAIKAYQQALQCKPDFVEAYTAMAMVYREQNQLPEVLECFHQALALQPDLASAALGQCIGQLPIIYVSTDAIQHRRTAYQQELYRLAQTYQTPEEQSRAAAAVGKIQPFLLAYQGMNDRELQALYGTIIHQWMASRYPQWSRPLPPPTLAAQEKLRVGFVSGFFRGHSNWKIPIQGWVEQLDRDRFELFGYYTGTKQDGCTAAAARACTKFVQGQHSIAQWGELIRQDQLHCLIFPEFGMDATTIQLGCLRLAPIQMTSWGHPETSGLPTIDYFLSSDLMEPENAQNHYTETLIRLPNLSIYYQPPTVEPKPVSRADIGLVADDVLFWCCQSLFKYLPQYDDVFPSIARALPQAKFVFIANASESITQVFRRRLEQAFQDRQLDYQTHCVFLPYMDAATFAGTTALADVFLDSIGWSGCNSTLEAIAHNIPIVTWPGELMRGRHTLAILKMMGMTETIAQTRENYVEIAVRLGQDQDYRHLLSQTINEQKYRLYGDRKPVQALADFLLSKVTFDQA
jgi:predicted O-linked N-acetylglucosamine transferase (SPINDLY family)